MRPQDNQVEDSLLSACNEFIGIASLTGNMEGGQALQERFSAIINLWVDRFKRTKDPYFPNIKDYIPQEQWDETTTVFRDQALRFTGALSEYLTKNKRGP